METVISGRLECQKCRFKEWSCTNVSGILIERALLGLDGKPVIVTKAWPGKCFEAARVPDKREGD